VDAVLGVIVFVGFVIVAWWILTLPADPAADEGEELLGFIAGNWDRLTGGR
jgi:hypothetical protein